MKTIKQLLMAIAVLLCSVMANAHDFEVNGIFYNITNSTDLIVEVTFKGNDETSYVNEYSGSVLIPGTVTYNGMTYNVTSIGTYAFYKCSGLTNITIPNSVTSIGSRAFYDCSGLTSVTIGNSVTSIGEWTFCGCSGLTNITIPNSVTSIGASAFRDCNGLTSIEIPNSVTSIGEWAFYGCSGLTSVTIGNSVTSIGANAFYDCSGLTSVTIGNSVTSIGDKVFSGCSSLTSITIPGSVTSIGNMAFDDCTSLKNLRIEEGGKVLKLGYNLYSNSTWKRGEGLFFDCPIDTLYLGRNLSFDTNPRACYSPFAYNDIKNIILGDSITNIPNYAFHFCDITNITIPKNVTSIGNYAFANCSLLTSVAIPDNVTSIGQYAFSNCSGLTDVTIDNDSITIHNYAFDNSNNLKNIYLIGKNAQPIIDTYSFRGFYTKVTLYVPYELIDIYKSTDIWKKFSNIQEYYIDEYFYISYMVDGSIYAIDSIKHGGEIILKDIPIKEGYTFSGWSSAPKKMPAENITISGTFSVNNYKVIYIVDGEVYDSTTVAYGSTIRLIEIPVKEGYIFSGWSEAPATMPAKDVIITGSFVHTSISGVSADTMVKVNGNSITLFGANSKAVAIYTINGSLVEKIDCYAGEEIALDKGVYIVRVGEKSIKLKL